MFVALLTNTAWLDEELQSFQHLLVGFMDEQVRVAQVVPQHLHHSDASVFGAHVGWQESSWAWLNRHRITKLDQALEPLGVNLIHALDGRLWVGAYRLALKMNVPVVFTANSHLDLKLVSHLRRIADAGRCAFVATTEPLAQAVRDRLPPAFIVEMIPPGTHPGPPVRHRNPDDALCAVISGRGQLDDRYQALLEALSQVIRHHPQAQFFFDGQGSDQHEIWQAASRLNLLANISLIPRRLGHRELLVRADVLIQPQPPGRSRGLTLQAMAHAVPVIAHHDPWLDYLHEDVTAWLIDGPDPDAWQTCITRLIEQPDLGRQLGQRAQHWVSENRLSAQQVAHTLDLYRRITGEPIKFPG